MARIAKIDKMVLAAVALRRQGKDPFTAEDLVVACHQMFPGDFALRGYPQFPNSNAIFSKIMGSKSPLVAKGFMEKAGTQLFRATTKAVARSEELEDQAGSDGATHRLPDREVAVELARLFGSKAWQAWEAGTAEELTLYQFCRFFGISTRETKWQAVASRLQSVAHIIEKAVGVGEAGESMHLPVRGRSRQVSTTDLRNLGALHGLLMTKFADELERWRIRATS